ncbi:TAXI family TRAP transporter solute-binding subunit [Ruegeria sp. 2012CJ41-6]|uniref:TAXI family TRAP transporter solute-binding subunit n=1 Tax=Ruegeria spongiae TaxID=2942209 RepID=A0ABT0Q8I9_9RHOB|nr:TAXI family TRAP transporter solute-binding subunit [Ruegeria spongiae]MCL6286194.1 TAXI family TRAP transporter solute-binding subunit [Ruegeria spongiae]
MKNFAKRSLQLLGAVLVMCFGPNSIEAQEFEKNILTGGPTGTYIQIGRDISNLMAGCGQTLIVNESAGSLENFLGVRRRRATQFGIVQSDVLEYLKTYSANDPDIARAIAGVRIAFPLYNEEVHILASKDLGSVADLNGKRVAVGVADSGTFLTASLLLDLVGVEAGETLTIGPDESMARLKNGEIDAFFYVAGAPASLFADSGLDASKFHLLPIVDPVLQAVYTPVQIPAGTYDFISDPLDTVAVKAVLMTYEYERRRNNYHRLSCDAVADVSNLILNQFSALQQIGHPKWGQVDLNDLPPGWDIGSCVNRGLDVNYVPNCRQEPAASLPDSPANAAYRERICAAIGC